MYRRLWGVIRGARTQLVLKVSISIGVMGMYVLQAFAASRVITNVFSSSGIEDYLVPLAVITIAMAVRALLIWAGEVCGKITAAKIKESIRVNLFGHFFGLGPGFMEEERTGKVQSIFTDGVEAMEVFLTDYLPQLLVTAGCLVVLLGYILSLDVVVGLIVFGGVFLTLLTPLIWDRLLDKTGHSHWGAYANMGAQFIDAIQGMTTLKTFNASDDKAKELDADSQRLFKQTMRRMKVSLSSSAVMGLASAAGMSLSVGIGAWRVAGGLLVPASLFIILFLAIECFRPLNDLSAYYHQSFMGMSAAKKMFDFLDSMPNVHLAEGGMSDAKAIDKAPEISFDHVSFSYLEGSRPALKDINLSIEGGRTAALVGKSGAGKSTVVNLLLRFFDPQEGTIRVGSDRIDAFSIEYWREHIAVVFQDTYLFYGTVSENLRLAKPGATQAELERAATLAWAHEFISELPDGYETLIGERGARLSGGQRQRIAIARAILKDAPILVLDEATSNVDAASERMIQDGLTRLMEGRTTLVVAHRLSTIQNADTILVFDGGKVVEQGTDAELQAQNGVYRDLIRSQQSLEGQTL
jgi:ATP-binding cassette subfamily B protein